MLMIKMIKYFSIIKKSLYFNFKNRKIVNLFYNFIKVIILKNLINIMNMIERYFALWNSGCENCDMIY